MRLLGRGAVITGGASGIGRAAALLFAREGGRVGGADIDGPSGEATVEQIRREGGEGLFVPCDVSRSDQVQAMIARTEEAFSPLCILVNNAAYLRFEHYGSVTTTSEEHWDICVAVT